MNTLDKKYQALLQDILDNGSTKSDRTGTGTISVFGRQIRHKMSEGFPLLTTKKMAWKTMVTELLWFLRGDTNIKFLVDNNCHIWDGDAYKNYCEKQSRKLIQGCTYQEFLEKIKTDDEFANKWGELGRIYGKQWRDWLNIKWETSDRVDPSHPERPMLKWNIESIDQIQNLINDLKTNPDSRRLMVTAWNPADLEASVLPPCHYGFQVYTRELSNEEKWEQYTKSGLNIEINGTPLELKHMGTPFYPKSLPQRTISLMFNMRSTDVGLGLSFNLSSYGLLLMMIAKQVNMVPDELIYNGGDVHLYLNHIEPIKEQLTREPYELPTVKLSDRDVNDISEYTLYDITLEGYQSHPTIKLPLSN